MFAGERELSGFVMETRSRMIGLPAGGVVAGLAGAPEFHVLERSAVRIVVATLAPGERDAFEEPGGVAGARNMALLAGDSLMQACKLELCPRVIKPRSRLPRLLVMAPCAVRAELAAVTVLVAAGAIPPEAEKGVIEVLNFDPSADTIRNLTLVMAALAFLTAMFTFESKSG